MSFAKGLLHVNILVYLIEGDENPCEMECFKLIGFQCNNVGWLLSYPIEKCSWVVLQLGLLDIDMKTQSVVVSACVLVIHERKSWQPQQTDVHLLFPDSCSYQIKH
jgi:hypothetical protein